MEYIPTEALMENTPGPATLKRKLIRITMLGKTEIPEEIPFRRAVAVAATAYAHDRGITRPSRVYDLLTSTSIDLAGLFVVFTRRVGPPKLVRADDYKPGPDTVIELDEIARLLRGV